MKRTGLTCAVFYAFVGALQAQLPANGTPVQENQQVNFNNTYGQTADFFAIYKLPDGSEIPVYLGRFNAGARVSHTVYENSAGSDIEWHVTDTSGT